MTCIDVRTGIRREIQRSVRGEERDEEHVDIVRHVTDVLQETGRGVRKV